MASQDYQGSVGVLFECVKEFSARLGDEVTLKPGDKVELISDDSEYGDGWYMGKNLTTGEVGLYPKAFTKKVSDDSTTRPGLLRSRSRRTVNGSPVTPTQQFNELSMVEESPNTTANTFNTFDSNDRSKYSSVHHTLNDIDKAIQELGSYDSTNGSIEAENEELGSQLNPADVSSWSPEQVTQYFSFLNFEVESAGQFARHKISGAILIELELSNLKELDIASFGTRFEIYKEIEELRAASKHKGSGRRQKLQAAPSVRRQAPNSTIPTRPLGHARKRSQSMDDIPQFPANERPAATEPRPSRSTQRPLSIANGFASPIASGSVGEFESPRRAPKPPVDRNQAYRFGTRDTSEYPTDFQDHSRQSSKAASSIYPDHQRTGSALSFSKSRTGSPARHERRTSDMSTRDLRGGKEHKRYSSILSFTSARESPSRPQSAINGGALKTPNVIDLDQFGELPDLKSPKRRSVSAKEAEVSSPVRDPKRTVSEAIKRPMTRTDSGAASPNVMGLGFRRKAQTSAFQEGIRDVTADDSVKTADYSGWMSKKGNVTIGSWNKRYFTLHGTRLSYFATMKDKREKGLIDITSHKVLPAKESDDKFTALYAASTGSGRYCFKLVPPAPGSRKGLTFTQQKVHYFAVDTKEEMRGWMAALMKATIDMDESVAVVSSCDTPTVSLQKAQEMLAQARDYARKKDLEDEHSEPTSAVSTAETTLITDGPEMSEPGTSPMQSPTAKNMTTPTLLSTNAMSTPKSQTSRHSSLAPPKIETSGSHSGFSSPYLLASGLLGSPKPDTDDGSNHVSSPDLGYRPSLQRQRTASTNPTPMVTNLEKEMNPAIISNGSKRVSSFRKR
ncbi:unnamed protein product [Kuraishia capsulata CBS 1993]|uniref:Protein BOI2 n=1 Tax=Kuraishia capsulata CBS 1993 TaxID=1382522 RepID=W6MRG1_9ASCO|nr:uncharacterized protein KUCA_T00003811001 [Kuraishia capsulata CBS 1993]CDK27832.1 unnamed protein product [Kuraishia capsulata CBS 1993]